MRLVATQTGRRQNQSLDTLRIHQCEVDGELATSRKPHQRRPLDGQLVEQAEKVVVGSVRLQRLRRQTVTAQVVAHDTVGALETLDLRIPHPAIETEAVHENDRLALARRFEVQTGARHSRFDDRRPGAGE